jgi:hypothetical protein
MRSCGIPNERFEFSDEILELLAYLPTTVLFLIYTLSCIIPPRWRKTTFR